METNGYPTHSLFRSSLNDFFAEDLKNVRIPLHIDSLGIVSNSTKILDLVIFLTFYHLSSNSFVKLFNSVMLSDIWSMFLCRHKAIYKSSNSSNQTIKALIVTNFLLFFLKVAVPTKQFPYFQLLKNPMINLLTLQYLNRLLSENK